MLRKSLLTSFLVGLALIAGPPDAAAQETGTIQALAQVISSLSVTGNTNLQFGTVTPGVAKIVDKNEPGFAGEWSVIGSVGAELTIDFTLPDSMILVSDSTLGLPVSFSGTDASFDDGSGGGQLAPSGVLDPNGLGTERLGAGGQLTVWIGGTATPRISQTGGNYAADIILSVAYTGN